MASLLLAHPAHNATLAKGIAWPKAAAAPLAMLALSAAFVGATGVVLFALNAAFTGG